MAFTDKSDIFGAVHEKGINTVVRHIMRQRPSLFNYATPVFRQRPELFCARIDPAQKVVDANNPLFTEVEPLPILGSPFPLGVNFCLQLTDAQVDFHPNNVINLPPELKPMAGQRFALRLKACAGIDCPPKDVVDRLLPFIEAFLVAKQEKEQREKEAAEQSNKSRMASSRPARLAASHSAEDQPTGAESSASLARLASSLGASTHQPGFGMFDPGNREGPLTLPTRELICFCLELFAVGHLEWGAFYGSKQQWLKPRLDGIEIVDLQPTPMENAIECYLRTVLQLGILPNLMVPMEKMILDITAKLKDQGLNVGQQITLGPSVVPTDVPNNPAMEDDQLKAFIKLTITEGA